MRGRNLRLMLMMFVQNMTFPVWFNTVIPYVKTMQGGDAWVPRCGMLMGVGMFASPLVCMFADRFLDSGKVLALCNFVAAAALSAAYFAVDPGRLYLLLLLATVALMPTWSVAAAIAMAHAPTSSFPYIRACGSVGWAASAVFSVVAIRWFGVADFDKSPLILAAGAAVSVAGGLVALLMPPTPPKAKGTPMSVADALGLRALTLLGRREFLVFSAVLLLGMVPFQWYMSYNTMYLDESGFTYLNLVQNLGQVAELGFMLVLPFILRRCGYKRSMVLGLGVLAARYGFFLAGAATGVHAFDFCGILLHGLIFGILIVGAQMYAAESAPEELRNQAQGYVMLLTAGVGGFLSVGVFDAILSANTLPDGAHDWTVPFAVALAVSLAAAALMALCFRPRAR
ncbi:MAG: MFS transporter [Kiritimatiellae bacterium]|nr:MFS transporter [Kiritimatiellia bacterium]